MTMVNIAKRPHTVHIDPDGKKSHPQLTCCTNKQQRKIRLNGQLIYNKGSRVLRYISLAIIYQKSQNLYIYISFCYVQNLSDLCKTFRSGILTVIAKM